MSVPKLLTFASVLPLLLGGCASVEFKDTTPQEYVSEHHGDVLSTGGQSKATRQTLVLAGLTIDTCLENLPACLHSLDRAPAIDDEQRLSTKSELWLGEALSASSRRGGAASERVFNAYLESARAAYAYLFFTARSAEQRVFESRQAQVVEFYNYAVQRAITRLFADLPDVGQAWTSIDRAGWEVLRPQSDVRFGSVVGPPSELIPADGLQFKGLLNEYERDGLGATFVAAAPAKPHDQGADTWWHEPDYASVTGLLTFPGDSLAQVLASRRVRLLALDPYADSTLELHGRKVPVAANFTAPYGVWLARSGFRGQSIRSLLGQRGAIAKPQVLLTRPFDPDRLTVILIHGLASSPEAWINTANALNGNERIRQTYQFWEVYYPTNVPIAVNTADIREALQATIAHFDPSGTSAATNNMVVIGHSMGGVIARLLVSSSDDRLWDVVPVREDYPDEKKQQLHEQLRRYLEFAPMPQISRAIFLASPHKGSPKAQMTIARWFGNLIHLPAELLSQNAELTRSMAEAAPMGKPTRVPNSIDNLNEKNAFIVASSTLPISPAVTYHSIVGVHKGDGLALQDTSDGVVPYTSAHLPGAQSELAVPSWHSVQETQPAKLEIWRILRLHAKQLGALHEDGVSPQPVTDTAPGRPDTP